MSPDALTGAIGPRTRAIVPVHLYGLPADMVAINRIAAERGVPVVEDAAQAHGARLGSRRVGGFGRVACFSFYPGKNLGALGEAGALVTNDPAIADRARMLRDHAQRTRYVHETIGYNYRMDNLQGAVLGIKLRRLDGWNALRRRCAQRYLEALADVPELAVPHEPDGFESVYHLFVVEFEERDRLAKALNERGVQTGLHYPIAVHRQPAYQDLGLGDGSYPVSERLARRCLSLPIHPNLSDEQIDYVCEQVRQGLR
jgi:dTDP-4-amino-4,6-dideoxygalactose transaminase